jgi:hypothetical protein
MIDPLFKLPIGSPLVASVALSRHSWREVHARHFAGATQLYAFDGFEPATLKKWLV